VRAPRPGDGSDPLLWNARRCVVPLLPRERGGRRPVGLTTRCGGRLGPRRVEERSSLRYVRRDAEPRDLQRGHGFERTRPVGEGPASPHHACLSVGTRRARGVTAASHRRFRSARPPPPASTAPRRSRLVRRPATGARRNRGGWRQIGTAGPRWPHPGACVPARQLPGVVPLGGPQLVWPRMAWACTRWCACAWCAAAAPHFPPARETAGGVPGAVAVPVAAWAETSPRSLPPSRASPRRGRGVGCGGRAMAGVAAAQCRSLARPWAIWGLGAADGWPGRADRGWARSVALGPAAQ